MRNVCDADPNGTMINNLGATSWFSILGLGIAIHLFAPESLVMALLDWSIVEFVTTAIPNIDVWSASSVDPNRTRVGLAVQWLLLVPLIPASWNYVSSHEGWYSTIRKLSAKKRLLGIPFLLLCVAVMVLIPEASDLKLKGLEGMGIHHMVTRFALKSSFGMSLVGAMQVAGAGICLVYIVGLITILPKSEQKSN